MMAFGGNNQAQVLFQHHRWTKGGQIEAKYTSRAANLYMQLLVKEVAKSSADEAAFPSSPRSAQSEPHANGLADTKVDEVPNKSSSPRKESLGVPSSSKASQSVASTLLKKPMVARKTGKTGGLRARKLTDKTSDSLYELKPEKPPVQVASSDTANSTVKLYKSRFEYNDSEQQTEPSFGGVCVLSHVAPPKAVNFLEEYEMDGGSTKKASKSRKLMRLKRNSRMQNLFLLPSSLAIINQLILKLQLHCRSFLVQVPSLIFLGTLQISQQISLLVTSLTCSLFRHNKILQGKQGRKLGSLASTLMTDLQGRIR